MRKALVLAALLGACAAHGPRPGASEAEVRAALGRPAMDLEMADGSRQLAFTSGPFGHQTHMAHIAPDGRLARLEQVLDDTRFHAIVPGMTSEELLRHIGPPHGKVRFANLGQTAWDYRFRDTWGYEAILSVMVDDRGVVAGRISRRLERHDHRR